jgi:hypothetical protein
MGRGVEIDSMGVVFERAGIGFPIFGWTHEIAGGVRAKDDAVGLTESRCDL